MKSKLYFKNVSIMFTIYTRSTRRQYYNVYNAVNTECIGSPLYINDLMSLLQKQTIA